MSGKASESWDSRDQLRLNATRDDWRPLPAPKPSSLPGYRLVGCYGEDASWCLEIPCVLNLAEVIFACWGQGADSILEQVLPQTCK